MYTFRYQLEPWQHAIILKLPVNLIGVLSYHAVTQLYYPREYEGVGTHSLQADPW